MEGPSLDQRLRLDPQISLLGPPNPRGGMLGGCVGGPKPATSCAREDVCMDAKSKDYIREYSLNQDPTHLVSWFVTSHSQVASGIKYEI